MARTERDYWRDLTVELRLAGLSGEEIGAVLEESRDHVAASGEPPLEAFGPAADYAQELGGSRDRAPARALELSRADLLAGAAQLGAWGLAVPSVVALATGRAVELLPGLVAGWLVLIAAFVWPVWPTVAAYAAGRTGPLRPIGATIGAVAASVLVATSWREPVLASLPALPALLVALLVVAGCWWRAWRERDPIRGPATDA